jgi:hypothetical protein
MDASNGNNIETKAEQSFDLDFVFDIEAKWTRNRFQGIDSTSYALPGLYNNPIPARFLALLKR